MIITTFPLNNIAIERRLLFLVNNIQFTRINEGISILLKDIQ